MIIFFDESFDNRHRYLLLGALFVPAPRLDAKRLESVKERHRGLSRGRSFSDVKYSKSGDRLYLAVCKDMVDLFADSKAYFRCVVIDSAIPGFSWSRFGGDRASPAVVKARAYSKFAELLLLPNLGGVENAVLLADSLSPMAGDDFVSRISTRFGQGQSLDASLWGKPQIRHVQRVDTSLRQYQLGQLCDVLLGPVLGELVPPRNPNKQELIQHLKQRMGIPSFRPDYWLASDDTELRQRHPRFHVWHWRPYIERPGRLSVNGRTPKRRPQDRARADAENLSRC